ncbi:MAG: Beta-1,3-glucosyltransferase [Ignavibacteriae bacterium]|nr:MAG: Beta-1,3-glucosyltransferase [Ignavibacteriota bacterium]
MTLVSVVIPTYNRADTIMRSLNSVFSQTFQEYELIVVDDGSTDNTYEIIKDLDPRLKIISQQNQGVSAARNNGIRASKGKYIALLDSDDEWDPLYLEACISFLTNHPDENVVHTEFVWKLRKDYSEIQPYADIPRIFLPLARKVGSNLLDLPPGETDHYLRIYKEKIPIGKWAESFLNKMNKPLTHYYRGYVFDHWRWGYLMSAWSTIFTKEAFEKIGGFANQYKTAEDYDFLTKLCKNYRVNFLPFPGAIKNEFKDSGQKLKEEHLASGKNTLNFAINYLERFEAIFLDNNQNDRELLAIKAQNETYISEVALRTGQKEIAKRYAKSALEIEPNIFRAKLILILLNSIPSVKFASLLYNLFRKLRYWFKRILKLSSE